MNFLWKKFEAAQAVLTKVFIGVKKDNNLIPAWLPSGRTVLLPKTDDLSDEKNFRPITCLGRILLVPYVFSRKQLNSETSRLRRRSFPFPKG